MRSSSVINNLIAAVILLTTLMACTGFSQENGPPSITKTFDLNQPGMLDVKSSGGGVTVSSHDRPKVIIHAYVRKDGKLLSSSDPLLSKIGDDLELIMEKNGNEIIVSAKQKSRLFFWNQTGVSFDILVPREMSCNLSSSGGGVRLTGVSGNHDLHSSGGGVKIAGVTGTMIAHTSGGGLEVTNHKGDLQLKSSGGKVQVNDAQGNINAHSSGGGVYLENISGEVDAHSSGGRVKVMGTCSAIHASSSGGPVEVDISGLSKKMNLKSSGGGINARIREGKSMGLDLDLKADRVNVDLVNFSGKSERDRVNGAINGGGIPVYISSSGGGIDLEFE